MAGRLHPEAQAIPAAKNLAAGPAYQRRLEAMREKLFSRLRQQGDPRMEGKGDVFDNYPTPSPARKGSDKVLP